MALAEQKGLALARSLLGRKPLQGSRLRSAPINDADPLGAAEPHRERRTKVGVRRAHRPLERPPGSVHHRRDLEALRVEHDLLGPRGGANVQRRRARHALGVEIGREIERHMGDARHLRPGKAVHVARIGRCQHRRHHPRPGFRRLVNRGRAGSDQKRRKDERAAREARQEHRATLPRSDPRANDAARPLQGVAPAARSLVCWSAISAWLTLPPSSEQR